MNGFKETEVKRPLPCVSIPLAMPVLIEWLLQRLKAPVLDRMRVLHICKRPLRTPRIKHSPPRHACAHAPAHAHAQKHAHAHTPLKQMLTGPLLHRQRVHLAMAAKLTETCTPIGAQYVIARYLDSVCVVLFECT